MKEKFGIYFDKDQDMYFIGVPAQGPKEEDFGVYFQYLGKYWVIKCTWNQKRQLVTTEELSQIVKEVIEDIKAFEQ